jgi:Tfp pilus assembly protein PilN
MHSDLEQEARLARLLRELPDAAAHPYGFGEFQRRALQRARASRSRASGQLLAATVVLVLVLVALTVRFDRPTPLARPPAVAEVHRQVTPAPATPAVRADVMERWLASLPSEPALSRVGNRAAVTGLEDRIAQVDDLLSAARATQASPARLGALQQQRARLVGALVQVRYAETLADASR